MSRLDGFDTTRYLLPMDRIQAERATCDILVVGGGIAGLTAAIAAAEAGVSVVVVTKDELEESNSFYAQGGIAAVLGAADSIELHVKDTLETGCGLADERVVRTVVGEGPEAIRRLIAWGSDFDRENGELLLSREGGHSVPRVVHARDMTGMAVQRALIRKVRSYENVRLYPRHFAVDLLTVEGACAGAVVSTPERGFLEIRAAQTLLVTGGGGQVYRETTNPGIATGDGFAMAFRAGAVLRDMEFVQFHPTILYLPGAPRLLITETVRGEGGILRDRYGRAFMAEVHEKAELAPRDVVSRAILHRMAATQYTHVFLDVTHLPPAFVRERFKGIYETCAAYDLDITREYIPVRPAAHYCIGGVRIDLDGRTGVPGLFAAGEVTSSGLHGANRLGSNSLLEGVVFGRRAAEAALETLPEGRDRVRGAVPLPSARAGRRREPHVWDFRNSIKSLMSRCVGIERVRSDLKEAVELMDRWARAVFRTPFPRPSGWELCNLLTLARLITEGALQREESRGVHFRKDFPEQDDRRWKRSLCFSWKGGEDGGAPRAGDKSVTPPAKGV